MNTDQLNTALKHFLDDIDNNDNRVLAADELPSCGYSLKRGSYLIVNTDPSEKRGTHWLAIYCCPDIIEDEPGHRRKVVEIFDSYGYELNTYPIIKKFILDRCHTKEERNNLLIRMNSGQIQSENSTACGAHCLLFLILRIHHGITMGDIIERIYTDNFNFNDCLAMMHYIDHMIKSFIL